MSKNDLTYLLKVAIFIALIVIAFKFLIYILPFIIIALIAMIIYYTYKKKKVDKQKPVKKEKIIKEAEIIKEVKD